MLRLFAAQPILHCPGFIPVYLLRPERYGAWAEGHNPAESPQEIMEEIAALNTRSAKVLENIRKLL